MLESQKKLIQELEAMKKAFPSYSIEKLIQIQRNEILFEALTDIETKLGEMEYWLRGPKRES